MRADTRPRAHRADGKGALAAKPPKPVIYRDGDGKPMAETELHRDMLIRLIQVLQVAFAADAYVYVSGNNFLYYEEGNPRAAVSPDVYVVNGVAKHRRDYYLLWEEGVPPCFVVEITSRKTSGVDRRRKWELYARLGVREYVLYDPRFPGLETRFPPLEGYRLGPNGYEPMQRDADGALLSAELGLRLALEGGLPQLYSRRTGERLLSPAEIAETEAARAQAAERALAAETEARAAAEARVAELEARLWEPPLV